MTMAKLPHLARCGWFHTDWVGLHFGIAHAGSSDRLIFTGEDFQC
jgi:hypothetical protein